MLSQELFYRFIISRRAGSLVKVISRISIIGIWLGVFALVLIMSVMNGFNRSIQDRLIKLEPHLVISYGDKLTIDEIKSDKVFQLLASQADMTTELFVEQDVILRTAEGQIHGAVAKGVSRQALVRLVAFAEKASGRGQDFVQETVEAMGPGEIIMGLSLAEATGIFEGNEVTIIPPEGLLLASGEVPIFTTGTVNSFVLTENERIDKNTIFYVEEESFPRLRESAGLIRGVEVRLENPELTHKWQQKLQGMGATVVSWKDRNASLFFALKVEKIVIAVLVGLSTLIAALSIISVMVLLLTQKRRDIGNFLAMGLTMGKTKELFINIGMYLALIGVTAGIITGIVASLAVDRYSQDVLPRFYQDQSIPTEIHWYQIALIILFAVSFTYLTLSWTMRRLSALNPSVALRS